MIYRTRGEHDNYYTIHVVNNSLSFDISESMPIFTI
jgi:hypothetical protein